MLDLDDRLDELKQLGLYRRTRMVSGPQGPRVVLDGRPVLVLCSGNSLGLADHPDIGAVAFRCRIGRFFLRHDVDLETQHKDRKRRNDNGILPRVAFLRLIFVKHNNSFFD